MYYYYVKIIEFYIIMSRYSANNTKDNASNVVKKFKRPKSYEQ